MPVTGLWSLNYAIIWLIWSQLKPVHLENSSSRVDEAMCLPTLCLRHYEELTKSISSHGLATPRWKYIQFTNGTTEIWLLHKHHGFHTSSTSGTSSALCSPAIISAGANHFTKYSNFYLIILHQFVVCFSGNGRLMDNLREPHAIVSSDG
jgi:hypothetical protein